jgi:hypothetical protein
MLAGASPSVLRVGSSEFVMNTPAHIKWTSISLLHYVIATYDYLLANDGLALPTVQYRGKIKLHGKNMAVQRHGEGTFAQSRGDMLTLPSGDLNGFARWTDTNNTFWDRVAPDITVFGEWCGPGVQKKMAISKHGTKVFAIFALQIGYGEDAAIVYDPEEIAKHVPADHPEVFILPWFGGVLELNYADKAGFAAQVAKLTEAIHAIEKEDPWVKEVFGISGMGEGIVFYPMGEHASSNSERLGRTMFKAKGVKHSKTNEKDVIIIAPEVLESVDGFVEYMVTDNRLEQAVEEGCGGEYHMRHTKAFIDWLTADVEKESVVELKAAGLEWDMLVIKAVQARGRTWLRERVAAQ